MSDGLLIELLVKSSVIAGVGLGLATALRFRPAADRVDILRATVCLLLVLPLIMAAGPALRIPLLPAGTVETAIQSRVVWAGAVEPVAGVAVSGSILWPSPLQWLMGLWAAGAVVVVARFAVGVWTLRRWTRAGKTVAHPSWSAPLERLASRDRPRLVVSSSVAGPLSWGLPPGVVLIGPEQLRRPESARAVLAHELAHLHRRDWIFLALSRLALGLFWFNPLVWVLSAALAARTEEAADAAALREIDRRTYARALVGLAADLHPPAAIGMAGPTETLTRRIACIMKTQSPRRPRPAAVALIVGALAAVATPLAAVELTAPAGSPSAGRQTPVAPEVASMTAPSPVSLVAPEAPVAAVLPVTAVAPVEAADFAMQADEGGSWRQAPPAPPVPPVPPAPPSLQAPAAPPAPPARPAMAPPAPRAPARAWSARQLSEQDRQRIAEARQAAVEARQAAAEVRASAPARAAAVADARAHARVAQAQATREMANARVHMARGADQMDAGADQMRQESRRLRDPAYRAEQIARARERGDTVTDAELQALAPRLVTQADELERRAQTLRERASAQP